MSPLLVGGLLETSVGSAKFHHMQKCGELISSVVSGSAAPTTDIVMIVVLGPRSEYSICIYPYHACILCEAAFLYYMLQCN